MERDFRHMTRNVHQVNFNSHAHVERDKIGLRPIQFFAISTHTLTWSVTALLYLLVQFLCHFNSHAHVERDYLAVTFRIIAVISTHTLTWSVTRQVLPYTACRKFQLTRSRGA